MVVVIVLGEVVDPEAVPLVDPWRERERNGALWELRGFACLLVLGSVAVWGAREPALGRPWTCVPSPVGDRHTHREQPHGGRAPPRRRWHPWSRPDFSPVAVKGHTTSNYLGTERDLEEGCPGQAGCPLPYARGLWSRTLKNDEGFATGKWEEGAFQAEKEARKGGLGPERGEFAGGGMSVSLEL